MSGYLRQELRELEILDNITRMRCEGTLPRSVTGIYRRRLIRSYYAWKSSHRDPAYFHPAMKWKASMGPRVPEAIVYSEWRPTVAKSKKRSNAVIDEEPKSFGAQPPAKRTKPTVHVHADSMSITSVSREPVTARSAIHKPAGLVWDARDWSCGYDAIFTILANLWYEHKDEW
ncbi:hypothetical protein DFH07DRAFT_741055, partial [Mycena maculata]